MFPMFTGREVWRDKVLPRIIHVAAMRPPRARIKDGRVTLAYLDESGWLDVFKDTHQLCI